MSKSSAAVVGACGAEQAMAEVGGGPLSGHVAKWQLWAPRAQGPSLSCLPRSTALFSMGQHSRGVQMLCKRQN